MWNRWKYWSWAKNQTPRAEPWPCELSTSGQLDFLGMWQSESIYFLLRSKESAYSVCVPLRSPFRVIDESYSTDIGQLLNQPTPAWKVFGTPLLRELERTVLFHNEPAESHFSYYIATGDECIEFVAPEPRIVKFSLLQLPARARELSEYFVNYLSAEPRGKDD